MTNHYKANKFFRKYLCRKDFLSEDINYYRGFGISKRPYKKQSNRVIRNFKGDIPSGSSYKKMYDLWWTLF